MKIGAQLKEIRAIFCDNSTNIMAEMVKITPQRISNYINGKSLGEETFNKIAAAFPEVNPSWLMTGEGAMIKGEQTPATEVEQLRERVAELERISREKDETIARLVRVMDGADKSEKNAG